VWPGADGPRDCAELQGFPERGFRFVDQLFSEAEIDELAREAQQLAQTVDPRAPGVSPRTGDENDAAQIAAQPKIASIRRGLNMLASPFAPARVLARGPTAGR